MGIDGHKMCTNFMPHTGSTLERTRPNIYTSRKKRRGVGWEWGGGLMVERGKEKEIAKKFTL